MKPDRSRANKSGQIHLLTTLTAVPVPCALERLLRKVAMKISSGSKYESKLVLGRTMSRSLFPRIGLAKRPSLFARKSP